MRPSRITVLYNTDYDEELTGPGIDVSAVEISARAIAAALKDGGFTVDMVGVAGRDVFEVLSTLRTSAPDIVFNLCESMAGDPCNEPTFAGLLDLFGIPYTGADLPALAACLHKRRSKDILVGRGIPTPPHRFLVDVAALEDPALEALDYPWFLKLAHEDASIGITEENRVRDAAALRQRARAMMAEFDQPVLAERYIEGREVNVTLLGNGADLTVLPLHEIDFSAMPAGRPRIVSYAAKWEEDHVDYAGTKPVPLRDATPAMIAACERVACAAWDAHGLRDYARVDLRIDRDGTPWVIDVNPNPDISPDAGVARSAAVAGLSYVQLITRITEIAWKRVQRR
ncbi:MAG TPA: ATP-grasp domain-containing protein [Kofleriaceae bacterium]|jgi:D-alanine-D-alanine ligase|nr:ATP-grasp domain-containing protein [Kofleriaceae bacterium]